MDDWSLPKPRLALLLEHFAAVEDVREPWRVAYPLREVLFLAVRATIANCDDYEDIVDWGEANLKFLRGFSDYHFGVPCADWLRSLMNRIDPAVFSGAFRAWVADCWPGRPELVAIDGKTSRRSHNKKTGKGPLHLVSAYATNSRLVLAQEAVDEKENEIVVIPKLLDQLDLDGALVSIDAIACNPAIAEAIVAAGADYLLPVKENQPTLRAEAESYFADAPEQELDIAQSLDTAHGRLEIRTHKVSRSVGWVGSDRAFPGAKRFPRLAIIGMIETQIEKRERSASSGVATSPRVLFRPRLSPMRCAAIGASRTAFIGFSTSPSKRTSLASGSATALTTWPWCATSPSISSDRPRTSAPSSDGVKSLHGTRNTSPKCYNSPPVNLDSLPWAWP